MISNVLSKLALIQGSADEALAAEFKALCDAGKPGNDPSWREFYLKVCKLRRTGASQSRFGGFSRVSLFT